MQSTSVDYQDRDTATLVPEWPTAMEPRSSGFKNDHLASGRPSIVRRMFRALARFSIAVLIGVCATLAWQSYGDKAREMLSTRVPSLRWLSVSTTTSTSGGLGISARCDTSAIGTCFSEINARRCYNFS
jgi:hypothetical protein